jgi:hypothetical protein
MVYNKDAMDEAIAHAVADERERCVLICKELASIHEAGARRSRELGSYTVWPFGARRISPMWEKAAQTQDAVARTLGVIANCIRIGYDTRKNEIDPNEQIWLHQDHICAKCGKPLGVTAVLVGNAAGHEGPHDAFHPECQP